MVGPFNPLGRDARPGLTTETVQSSRVFLKDNSHKATRSVVIEKDSEDVGNTGKEHKLRAGLVLLKVVAEGPNEGKYVDPDHADAPANNDIDGSIILLQDVNMFDREGVREDKTGIGITHGFVDSAKILYNTADATRQGFIQDDLKLVLFE